MLAQLRESAKGWVAKILLGFLVLAFGIWGIGDIFRTQTETTVATIGEREIDSREFLREFEQLRERFAAQTGSNQPLPQDQAFALGLDRVALNQLISRTVLEEETARLGLAVSDQTLVQAIQEYEAFEGPTGRFDPDVYRNALARAGMTPQMFEAAMTQDFTRIQLVETVMNGLASPRTLAEWLFRLQGERRRVTYLAIPVSAVGALPEPMAGDLEALHQAETARFTAPETRDFTYLQITPDMLLDEIEVTEEEIAEVYEFNKTQYVQPERRAVRQLTFDTLDAAQAAATRITDALSFTEVALERGFTPDELDLGNFTRADFLDEAVADAAFALTQPGVTAPIEGPLGYVIVAVDQITPATETPLADVRDDLRTNIALDRAQDAMYDLVTRIEDMRAGGNTLEEISESMAIPVRSIAGLARNGMTAAGTALEGDPVNPAILTQVYESDVGVENDFREIEGSGYFVSRVDGITPSALRPFETVRDDALAVWQERERAKALVALGEATAQKVDAGQSLQAVASSVSAKVVTPVDPIGRGSVDDSLTADLVRDLFRAEINATVQGTGQGGRTYVIARVSEVVPVDDSQLESAVTSIRGSLNPALAEEISEQLVVALRDDIGVEINDRAIAFALGQDGQQQQRTLR